MAKLSFNKLDLKKNQEIIELTYNEQTIEVKQYLPIEEKLEMISKILSAAIDENHFANTPKREVFIVLEIINYYTNINFTEKQLEDPVKLYDLIVGNGLFNKIFNIIPESEQKFLLTGIESVFKNYYEYKNSALGIIESISQDYSNLNFDASALQKNIADPNNLELLKEVLTKLG